MENIIGNIIWFLFVFGVVYLIFYYYIVKISLKYEGIKAPSIVCLIMYGYDIDIKRINYRRMLMEITISSAFIIALTSTIIFATIEGLLISAILILVISLIFCLLAYMIIGKRYERESNMYIDTYENEIKIVKKAKKKRDIIEEYEADTREIPIVPVTRRKVNEEVEVKKPIQTNKKNNQQKVNKRNNNQNKKTIVNKKQLKKVEPKKVEVKKPIEVKEEKKVIEKQNNNVKKNNNKNNNKKQNYNRNKKVNNKNKKKNK